MLNNRGGGICAVCLRCGMPSKQIFGKNGVVRLIAIVGTQDQISKNYPLPKIPVGDYRGFFSFLSFFYRWLFYGCFMVVLWLPMRFLQTGNPVFMRSRALFFLWCNHKEFKNFLILFCGCPSALTLFYRHSLSGYRARLKKSRFRAII